MQQYERKESRRSLEELVAENNRLLRDNNLLLKGIDDKLRKIVMNTA